MFYVVTRFSNARSKRNRGRKDGSLRTMGVPRATRKTTYDNRELGARRASSRVVSLRSDIRAIHENDRTKKPNVFCARGPLAQPNSRGAGR